MADPSRLTTIVYTNLFQGGGKAFGPDTKAGTPLQLDDITLNPAHLPDLEMELPEGLSIMHFDQVVALGTAPALPQHAAESTSTDLENGESCAPAESPPSPPPKGSSAQLSPPSPDTMAVVMYTSGSTGKPKGVCIAHKNLCASVGGMARNFAFWGKEGEEAYLAYLPAAHIFELVCEIAMISFGATLGFACPRSIASSGACRMYVGEDGQPSINFEANLTPGRSPGGIQACSHPQPLSPSAPQPLSACQLFPLSVSEPLSLGSADRSSSPPASQRCPRSGTSSRRRCVATTTTSTTTTTTTLLLPANKNTNTNVCQHRWRRALESSPQCCACSSRLPLLPATTPSPPPPAHA